MRARLRWSSGRPRRGRCRRTSGSRCTSASTTCAGSSSIRGDGRCEKLVIAKDLLGEFAEKTGFEPEGGLARRSRGRCSKAPWVKHPFLDRESKVILGDFVTTETGTGAVHIAPGHGADDYVAGQEHGLEVLSPVDDDGNFTDEVGMPEFVGMHVFEANAPIVELLRRGDHLLGEERYRHSYPHCWRSKTPIIFRAVRQFFISHRRAAPDRPRGDRQGRVAAAPGHATGSTGPWKRGPTGASPASAPGACRCRSSSQPEGDEIIDAELARKVAGLIEDGGTNLWFEKDDAWWNEQLGLPGGAHPLPATRSMSGSTPARATSPCSTGIPSCTRPADLYLEATDQHRGWFQISLMLSVAVRDAAPYKAVMTHGFVTSALEQRTRSAPQGGLSDIRTTKVSKSDKKKGKPINAEHFYNKYGADILRLWVASVDWQTEVPVRRRPLQADRRALPPPAQHAADPARQPGRLRPSPRTRLPMASCRCSTAGSSSGSMHVIGRVPRGLRPLRVPQGLQRAEPVLHAAT